MTQRFSHGLTVFGASDGMVSVDIWPSSLSMTPEAAIVMADGITDAAAEALGQREMEAIRRTLPPT